MSPRDPDLALVDAYGDIQHVGVAADAAGTNIFFGISSWANWSSPNETVYNIWIDNNEDGTWDRVVFNTQPGPGLLAALRQRHRRHPGQLPLLHLHPAGHHRRPDLHQRHAGHRRQRPPPLRRAAPGGERPPPSASPPATTISATGWSPARGSCRCAAPCRPSRRAAASTTPAPASPTWDRTARGLDFGGTFLYPDLNGDTVPVTWNTANLTVGRLAGRPAAPPPQRRRQPGPGGAARHRAEGRPLDLASRCRPPTPVFAQNVTFTVTVTNHGPNTASGIQRGRRPAARPAIRVGQRRRRLRLRQRPVDRARQPRQRRQRQPADRRHGAHHRRGSVRLRGACRHGGARLHPHPFVRHHIQAAMGEGWHLIDTAWPVSRQAARLLGVTPTDAPSHGPGDVADHRRRRASSLRGVALARFPLHRVGRFANRSGNLLRGARSDVSPRAMEDPTP